MAECLTGLMGRDVESGSFSGFEYDRSIFFSNLQYADDTLRVGRATYEKPCTLKAVLRGFELVLELKVNFHKSCTYGVNVSEDFLVAGSNFLCCNVGGLPFIYLGLPLGGSPKRQAAWKPVVDVLKKRLSR